jgi:ABC-type uncharacterized transport system ATPase component
VSISPVDEGSFVIVIGTNGSGKSTLLNAVAGAFLLDSGTITLDGSDITSWPEHRRAKLIGRVFQNPFSGTAPSMSIAENLALAARRGEPRGLGLGAQRIRSGTSLAIASVNSTCGWRIGWTTPSAACRADSARR